MQSFAEIRKFAEERKGGADALDAILASPEHTVDIASITDDRILSKFSQCVFQSGFKWSVVQNKWNGFEAAFHGFDVGRNAMMSDDDFDIHMKDISIIRFATKILSVRDNAVFLADLAKEHGSAARFFQDWPCTDLIGLLDLMKSRESRLGGNTGQNALRLMGKDSFVLSRSVQRALVRANVIEGSVTSKSALKKIQNAFDIWTEESGKGYTHVSRVLAQSIEG